MTQEELTDAIAAVLCHCFEKDWNTDHCAEAIIGNVPIVAALPELISALHQYRADLRRPPSTDSLERRCAMIDALLAKAGAA